MCFVHCWLLSLTHNKKNKYLKFVSSFCFVIAIMVNTAAIRKDSSGETNKDSHLRTRRLYRSSYNNIVYMFYTPKKRLGI